MLLQCTPGNLCPVFTWRWRRRFLLFHQRFRCLPVTHRFTIPCLVSTSASPLAFPGALASLTIPPNGGMRSGHLLLVSTTHSIDHPAEPPGWLLRSCCPFGAVTGALYPPGSGGEVKSQMDVLDPAASRVRFGRSLLPRVGSSNITMVHLRVRLRSP